MAFQEVLKLVKKHRSDSNHSELEIRIGSFSTEGNFTAGYNSNHIKVINRLNSRLKKTCAAFPTTWVLVPQYSYIVGDHGENIRSTVIPNKEPEIIKKTRVNFVNLTSDRPMHLRVTLSNEIPIKSNEVLKRIQKTPPISVRYVQRASFIHILKMGCKKVEFRVDISKVGFSGSNKLEATKAHNEKGDNCSYHCETELVTKLRPITDKKLEHREDEFIAEAILSFGKSLLGSFEIQSDGSSVQLPAANLYLLNSDIGIN